MFSIRSDTASPEKQRGSLLSEDEVLKCVVDAIVFTNGAKKERLQLDTRVREDAGVAGDDGDELFDYLDKRFEMDWSGLDLGIHFGNEGIGVPLPWQIDSNCVSFEPQPLTVRDLVHAIRAERWPGTIRVPVTQSRRRWFHVWSWVKFGFLFLSVLLGVLAFASRWL